MNFKKDLKDLCDFILTLENYFLGLKRCLWLNLLQAIVFKLWPRIIC